MCVIEESPVIETRRLTLRAPAKAERAILVLIDGAGEDIETVLNSRRKLPSLSQPAQHLKAARPVRTSAD